jgi:hypothetical protein
LNYLGEHLGPIGSSINELVKLKKRMVETIKHSDMIGIRDDIVDVKFEFNNIKLPAEEFLEIFRNRFRLREADNMLPYAGSRRIALLHQSLLGISFNRKTRFCSSWVHYDLHMSGYIFKVLMEERTVGVISTREELCTTLESIFNINVKYWKIPDMYRDIGQEQIPSDYIEQLEKILRHNLVDYPGMLCIVGGGLYGKLYCNHIRSQGGVALDLGSLLDAWAGIHTRPAVYRTLFSENYDNHSSPNELLLTAENVDSILRANTLDPL